MSYLSTALNRALDRYQWKQADVARESGLTRSHVSRVCNGDQRSITDDDFVVLLRAFRRDPRDQAELVAARCMDARVGPGANLVEISIKGPAPAPTGTPAELPDVELSHETERAFAWLRRLCPVNPELEKHLVGYAKLTGMK
jgi:transcriptional regulator with XRE-family HTH domain